MRKWLAEHPAVVVIAFILVVCIAGGLIWSSQRGPAAPKVVSFYFYDMATKELFAAPSTSIPPIAAPSGGADGDKGVRAYVFSCGDCGNAAERTIGWLELYTPEAKKKLEPLFGPNRSEFGPTSPEEVPGLLSANDHLIASVDGVNWLDAKSLGATNIRQDARKPCASGERPKECRP